MTTPAPPRCSKEHTATFVSATAMLTPPRVQEVPRQVVKLFSEARVKRKMAFQRQKSLTIPIHKPWQSFLEVTKAFDAYFISGNREEHTWKNLASQTVPSDKLLCPSKYSVLLYNILTRLLLRFSALQLFLVRHWQQLQCNYKQLHWIIHEINWCDE